MADTVDLNPAPERYCPTCDRSFDAEIEHCPDDGTRLVEIGDIKDPLIGKKIEGRFTVTERLGAGGMGVVYRALQHSVGREVALKVIHSRKDTDRDTVKRFMREAKLASRLAQPNTVTVLDFGQTDDGMLYLVMELIEGRTLTAVLDDEGRLPPARMVRIGVQICDALDAAHRLSIVHRDLKPENIIILDDPPGRDMLKVLDFGLAKSLDADFGSTVTDTGFVLGTPTHIAPEVAQGEDADPRSDLYSMGLVLYECLSGQLPWAGKSLEELMTNVTTKPPAPLPDTVSATVRNVIGRLIERHPDNRYTSAAQAREALVAAVERRPEADTVEDLQAVVAPTIKRSLPLPEPKKSGGKRPVAFDITAGVLILAAVAGGWWLFGRGDAGPTAGEAAPVAAAQIAPPGAPATVELELVATPSATVSVDGKVLGETPQVFQGNRGSTPLQVVFSKPGHTPVTKSVVPQASHKVAVELRPQAPPEPRPSARSRKRPKTKPKPKPKPKPAPVEDAPPF